MSWSILMAFAFRKTSVSLYKKICICSISNVAIREKESGLTGNKRVTSDFWLRTKKRWKKGCSEKVRRFSWRCQKQSKQGLPISVEVTIRKFLTFTSPWKKLFAIMQRRPRFLEAKLIHRRASRLQKESYPRNLSVPSISWPRKETISGSKSRTQGFPIIDDVPL